MAKNPRTDKAYLREQAKARIEAKKESNSSKSKGTHVERPPLSNDSPEWGDYAYTASDF